MDIVNFFGHECVSLENRTLKLLISRSVGPRILSLSLEGGENLLAELPDFVTDCPGIGAFHFYGGHRLWHAPEIPSLTYLPDDSPVDFAAIEHGYRITQNIEIQTGLEKSMEVLLPDDGARVVITHILHNKGLGPVTCAPWAITQLKVGGIAILPQACEETGVLPNRSLVLWPYTNPSHPNVTWGQHYILVQATMDTPFKVGFPNPRSWLAYWLNGTLFVKRAKYDAQSSYYDFGSSSELYCNDQFVELETLAPIGTIEPGTFVTHMERWELYKNIDCPHDVSEVQSLVTDLGLE